MKNKEPEMTLKKWMSDKTSTVVNSLPFQGCTHGIYFFLLPHSNVTFREALLQADMHKSQFPLASSQPQNLPLNPVPLVNRLEDRQNMQKVSSCSNTSSERRLHFFNKGHVSCRGGELRRETCSQEENVCARAALTIQDTFSQKLFFKNTEYWCLLSLSSKAVMIVWTTIQLTEDNYPGHLRNSKKNTQKAKQSSFLNGPIMWIDTSQKKK